MPLPPRHLSGYASIVLPGCRGKETIKWV